MNLTDRQWFEIEAFFEKDKQRKKRGRPATASRIVLGAILWILKTGAPWRNLPASYPPFQTCHRWFQRWNNDGTLRHVITVLLAEMRDLGLVDLSEAYIDGSFASAKQGGHLVGRTKRGKGTKIMAIVEKSGLPVSCLIASASPHEVTLVEPCIDRCWLPRIPTCLIGDKAYDSDKLDERLAARGIVMIAPHKANRRKKKTQDGRRLRRYGRRWKVERFFAWLQNYRRIVTRYEQKAHNFLGMIFLACLMIILNHYLNRCL